VGYENGSDEREVTLLQEVYDRLAQGITGEFSVGETALLDKANR
jgi:hypothetical protein